MNAQLLAEADQFVVAEVGMGFDLWERNTPLEYMNKRDLLF